MIWYQVLFTFLLYSAVMGLIAHIYLSNCDEGYIPTAVLRTVLWMYMARVAVLIVLISIMAFSRLSFYI
jgi:hypothetical protein